MQPRLYGAQPSLNCRLQFAAMYVRCASKQIAQVVALQQDLKRFGYCDHTAPTVKDLQVGFPTLN